MVDPIHSGVSQDELQERSFTLKCKVMIKDVSYTDIDKHGAEIAVTRKICFLVPESNDEMVRFYNAWLPGDDSYRELVGKIGSPVSSPCRLAVGRANKNCLFHHLHVMTKGVEDILIRKKIAGSTLKVEILPALDDESVVLDDAIQSDTQGESFG